MLTPSQNLTLNLISWSLIRAMVSLLIPPGTNLLGGHYWLGHPLKILSWFIWLKWHNDGERRLVDMYVFDSYSFFCYLKCVMLREIANVERLCKDWFLTATPPIKYHIVPWSLRNQPSWTHLFYLYVFFVCVLVTREWGWMLFAL